MKRLATSTKQGVCALLLVASSVADAQELSVKRVRAQVSRELTDSLTRILSASVKDRAFPGAYVIVGDSRGTLAKLGVGRLDWAKSPKPAENTLWDLASLTKVIATTTALAQLVEQGRVVVDSPVYRYLPEWTGSGREAVTVRHLLTHTSALPAFKPYDTLTHNADSLAALIKWSPLERAPGERMIYSDIGAFMMGEVVERVSGMQQEEYFAANVARPLKLKETLFNPPRNLLKRIAPTEFDSLRGGLVHGKVHDERAYYLGGGAAHAGLFGSARDLARFATMMLRGGTLDGARILQPATIAQFTGYADSSFSNRGLGWQKIERESMPWRTASPWAGAGNLMSSRAFGHTGFTGTSIAIDPELDLFIILLSNRVNPTRNNPRIADVRRRVADAVVSVMRARSAPSTSAGVQ
jgi:CubicO group peptidase (beta-lactamase class C family)